MNIGQKIKKRREELNITQDELAKMVGYTSRSTINKIEQGKNDIRRNKISQMALALNVSPAYLMGWEEKNDIYWDEMFKYWDIKYDIKKINEELKLYKKLGEEKTTILILFEYLNDSDKDKLIDYIEFILDKYELDEEDKMYIYNNITTYRNLKIREHKKDEKH